MTRSPLRTWTASTLVAVAVTLAFTGLLAGGFTGAVFLSAIALCLLILAAVVAS